MGQSILSKETTRWQGLGVEPPTFRSEVHYTTTPSPFFKWTLLELIINETREVLPFEGCWNWLACFLLYSQCSHDAQSRVTAPCKPHKVHQVRRSTERLNLKRKREKSLKKQHMIWLFLCVQCGKVQLTFSFDIESPVVQKLCSEMAGLHKIEQPFPLSI